MSIINTKKELALQLLVQAVSILQDGPDESDLFHAADIFDKSWDIALEVDGETDGNNFEALDELVHDLLTFFVTAEATEDGAETDAYVHVALPSLLQRIGAYFANRTAG